MSVSPVRPVCPDDLVRDWDSIRVGIDVLVVVQPDTERVRFEDRIIDIAFDVNLDFGIYISPRVVTPGILNDPVWRGTPFIKNVARESIAL